MVRNIRNVAIIMLMALAVLVVPGGGNAAAFVTTLLSTIFLAALAWFGVRLYREQWLTLSTLTESQRTVLYSAIGVAVVVAAATGRLWASGPGTVIWLLLLGGAAYAAYAVYRASRSY